MSAAVSGMIGLGNMGGRIARRIRDAGHVVRGFDVSGDQLAASGIDPAASIADLAGNADVVFLSLPDSRSSRRSSTSTTGCWRRLPPAGSSST